MRFYLMVGVSGLLMACSGSPTEPLGCEPNEPGPSIAGSQLAALPPLPTGHMTSDDEWAVIAREVPGGWGGAFFDQGEPVIYLVQPEQRASAVSELNARLPWFPFSSATVRKGRWDFAQLYDWYRFAQVTVGWPGGMLSSDIQEAENRLVYGVLADSMASVQEAFAAADLPCELVRIREESPPTFPQAR